uniref:Si:dkey-49c17.4 n=1 Tax=Maylandia zebra TaxID=106582 RepID=A0A3P9B6M7_9CICH
VFKLTLPVLDYTHPTKVELDIILYAILAVVGATLLHTLCISVFDFSDNLTLLQIWNNERISWDPDQFCGITHITIPREILWKPDVFIYEMTAEGTYDGTITSEDDIKIVSTCKMDVHKFPFDTCLNSETFLSFFLSFPKTVDEMQLSPFSNSSRATQFSREVMKTQGEWEFLQLSISKVNMTFENKLWESLIYTRRPLLHVINFLLPILFFLTLDLASFFIADHRGEKLGFKVTVLLAISVLLLILNDILPSMSNKTPLIATYCIVIFALMLLSLLETILVTHLIEKDSQVKLKVKNEHKKAKTNKSDAGEIRKKLLRY